MRFLLASFVFLSTASLALSAPIMWDFSASGGYSGSVTFDDSDAAFVGGGNVDSSNAVDSLTITDGTNVWDLATDSSGLAPQFTLGPTPSDPSGSSFNFWAVLDDFAPAGLGAGLQIGGQNGQISGLDGSATLLFEDGQFTAAAAVPEPASVAIWSLLGLSLAGFGYYRSRRAKK